MYWMYSWYRCQQRSRGVWIGKGNRVSKTHAERDDGADQDLSLPLPLLRRQLCPRHSSVSSCFLSSLSSAVRLPA